MFWSKKPADLPSTDALQKQLNISLHITPDDIAANRAGKLSAAQQVEYAGMMKQGQKAMLIIVPLVLLMVVVVIGFQMFTNNGGMRQVFEQNPAILIAGLGGSLLLYLLVVGYAYWRSANTSPATVKVASVTGKIKLTSYEAWGRTAAIASVAGVSTRSIMVQVGRQRIYTTNEAVESALVDGAKYTVYFIKSSGVGYFVGAEVAS